MIIFARIFSLAKISQQSISLSLSLVLVVSSIRSILAAHVVRVTTLYACVCARMHDFAPSILFYCVYIRHMVKGMFCAQMYTIFVIVVVVVHCDVVVVVGDVLLLPMPPPPP